MTVCEECPSGCRLRIVASIDVRMVRRKVGHAEELLEADLVVEATGRGSRSPAWLAGLGYEQPREEKVTIHLGYASCEYRRTAKQLPGTHGLAIAGAAPHGRTGVALAQEDDRWHVTVGGYNGDFAPLDQQGFVEFAKGLPTTEIYDLIKDAEPLTDPVAYRFAANLRRHYEGLQHFPNGYLVFGDALCSFNPVYAQGMTVATMEALVLQECLAEGSLALSSRFFKAVSVVLDAPSRVAVGNDLQYPHVEGKRSAMGQFINWYIGKRHIAACHDAALSVGFLRVVNMLDPATRILHRKIMLRVMRANIQRTRTGTASVQQPPVVALPLRVRRQVRPVQAVKGTSSLL